jgi:hypothetical protein
MGTFLSERELGGLTAPDNTAFPSPIPLQMVSNESSTRFRRPSSNAKSKVA